MSEYSQSRAAPGAGFRRLLAAAWRLAQAGIAVYGLLTIAYLLARLTVGERWNAVAWANNFVPWLALGSLIAAVAALPSRRRWALLALHAPMLAAFVLLYGELLLPRRGVVQARSGHEFTAATYNILSKHSEPARVLDVIRAMDADIVGLQEVGPRHVATLQAALAEDYPYQVWYPRLPVHGVACSAATRSGEEALFYPLPDSMLHLRAVVEVEGAPVTVFVAHPDPRAGCCRSSTTTPGATSSWRIWRARVEAERGPVLVLCDCNMSDQSDAYRAPGGRAARRLPRGRMGHDFSFPNRPGDEGRGLRLVRIDYVWHDDHAALEAHPRPDAARPITARSSRLALEGRT